ncbi:MAG: SAM-dependent DNA methyltransferase [Candidatus Heimdallarchaeota archaeon]|nr:MAG: SAM-dependent DNA methyltransferase [Candidatus Heimdallarchaeota archaeon]
MIQPKIPLKYNSSHLTLFFTKIIDKLASEIPSQLDVPNLFVNIFGSPSFDQKEEGKVVKISAAYLLVTQIIFYQILSLKQTDLLKLDIDSLNPDVLTGCFEKALRITKNPVFKHNIVKKLDNGTFSIIKGSIIDIIELKPELLQYEVLALIFNSLIPNSLRKRIGAFYSGFKTAKLLSHFAIKKDSVTIFDPACGSGALLASSYQRKKELIKLKKGKFTDADHRRFLSSDITGTDIMPFAIHLTAIHLTLQAPFCDVQQYKLAIQDSILLNPTSKQLDLDFIDLVIMNPPFVRQESMRKIRSSYKEEIYQNFKEYSPLINKKMGYYCYFLFLADKFLKSGGKIATVIPASFLRIDTTFKVRKWLLEQYDIQYIICQQDKPNFSEDTAFREVLLIATKNGPTSEIEYIIVKDLETTESFDKFPDSWKRKKVLCDDFSSTNLFLPIATMNKSNLLKMWQLISNRKDLILIHSFQRSMNSHLKRGIETTGGFKIQNLVINEGRSRYLRPTDIWIHDNETPNHVNSLNRNSNLQIRIPKECLIPHLRRMSGETRLDVSNKKEYVIISPFSQLRDFIDLNEDKTNIPRFKKWRTYVEERTTNLMLARRFDICASGTSLFSFFSKDKRAPPGVMWSILNLPPDDAKIICLFFNSTLNILQIFLNRVETRGAWMQLHEYVIEDLKVPNIRNWTIEDRIPFYELFDEIKDEEFPPLWQQLAMNVTISEIEKEDLCLLEKQFPKLAQVVGKQHRSRKKLDTLILDKLGIKMEIKKESFLQEIYLNLLLEMALLKKLMN